MAKQNGNAEMVARVRKLADELEWFAETWELLVFSSRFVDEFAEHIRAAADELEANP